MRGVVTGGAGFIGSNLVDALLERGDEVTAIDSLVNGKRSNLEGAIARGATLSVTDVRDADAIRAVFERAHPEVVFHLAAQADVRVSVADPRTDADVNVLGTITVLDAALAVGARRVINSSTGGGLYGDAEVIPTPEAPPGGIHPMAPYGQGKLAAEGYCELFSRLHGLSTISLRYGNVYGPRQDLHGEAGVVAIFCGCLVEGRTPAVFGDGRQTRDWVEVGDVVDALREVGGESGAGALPEPTLAPARAGEVQRSCLDVTRARDELGWEATVPLHDGLRRILARL
jgi:UDP-glucose 4-epimerase